MTDEHSVTPGRDSDTRVVEFYAGIGGLHLALATSSVRGTVVRAYDWDQSACQVYEANHGQIIRKADISKLSASELAALGADLWLLSPSCQPYTVLNPLAKGGSDPRAKSFIYLTEEVLPELVAMERHPKCMLVENVAGFETSITRQRLLETLDNLGYDTLELLLTPLQFGIPNSRLRYYLLAKTKPLTFRDTHGCPRRIWRHIPGCSQDWVDPRSEFDLKALQEVRGIRDFLDRDGCSDQFKIPDRVLEKWGRLFDIVYPTARRTCCFTRGYTKMAERAGSILQMNEDLDTTVVFDQFLAAQRNGDPEAVRILDPLQLRYFSPSELLRLFRFDRPSLDGEPSLFQWPPKISTKTKYKLIGNSTKSGKGFSYPTAAWVNTVEHEQHYTAPPPALDDQLFGLGPGRAQLDLAWGNGTEMRTAVCVHNAWLGGCTVIDRPAWLDRMKRDFDVYGKRSDLTLAGIFCDFAERQWIQPRRRCVVGTLLLYQEILVKVTVSGAVFDYDNKLSRLTRGQTPLVLAHNDSLTTSFPEDA